MRSVALIMKHCDEFISVMNLGVAFARGTEVETMKKLPSN